MNQQQPAQDGAGGPPGGGRPAPRPEDAGREIELKNSINTIFTGRALLAKSRDLLPVLRDKWGVAMQVLAKSSKV